MPSSENFKVKAQDFVEVSPEEANRLIEQQAGNIVTVMRETCPFCRKFINKIHKLGQKHDLVINYLDSEGEDQEGISQFREKYDLPTVPAVVYSSETAGTVTRCDSSLSVEDMEDLFEIED